MSLKIKDHSYYSPIWKVGGGGILGYECRKKESVETRMDQHEQEVDGKEGATKATEGNRQRGTFRLSLH